LSSQQLDRFAITQHTSSDLRSLGIEHYGAALIRALLKCFTQVIKRGPMCLVVAVRKVETSDVHASIKHFDEHFNLVASGSVKIK